MVKGDISLLNSHTPTQCIQILYTKIYFIHVHFLLPGLDGLLQGLRSA